MMPCRNMIRLLPRLLLLSFLMTVTSGCIKDGECNSPVQTLLYINVEKGANSSSGFYEKDSMYVDNAIVLIYDQDSLLQRIVKLSREEIENRTPVELEVSADNHLQIVVWGNLNGSEELSDIVSGFKLSSARLNMKQENGYTIPTDNLYYGFKVLTDDNVQEVVISPKTGHVCITARGLDNMHNDTDGYYFMIESNCNSYDFYGRPQKGKALLKAEAEARTSHQEIVLVHQPVNLIACPDISGEKQSVNVSLYKRTPFGDVLLSSSNTDTEGDWIITRSGENTNILLDLTGKDRLNVYVILTPWDHIYQWSWW